VAVNRDLSSHDSRVHIFATENETFMAAAAAVTKVVGLSISKDQTSNVILAAGNSISKTLSFLSSVDTDWSNVNWFLADERCVDAENELRNDKQIADVLRNTLGTRYGHIFSPSSHLSPKEAAGEYASRIEQINMFDLCLLGVGNDGIYLPKKRQANTQVELSRSICSTYVCLVWEMMGISQVCFQTTKHLAQTGFVARSLTHQIHLLNASRLL